MEAHLHKEFKLWSFIVLFQKHIKNARRRSKERNLTWRNSRGWQLWDTFRVLQGVHFMHTICLFESREVRSSTLQMVRELELKRRSYGCLKTTEQSWAKWAAKISQGVSQLRNHPLAHECHFAAPPPHFAAAKWAAKMSPPYKNAPWLRNDTWLRNGLQATNQVANHLQVAESPPSCEITNSTCKIKVQTWKMDNSTCEIHLCNLRYLLPTKLDFFSQDILCKFLFSPCNQSKILLGFFLEISSLYITLNQCKEYIRYHRCNPTRGRNIFYRALALLFLHIFVFSLFLFLAKQTMRMFPQRMSG